MTQSRADRVIKYAAIVAPTIAVLTLLWAGVALPGEIQEVKAEAKALDERVDTGLLDSLTASVGLDAVVGTAETMLAGETTGRIVVDVRA